MIKIVSANKTVENHALTSAGLIDTNRRLSELQFSDILTYVASTPLLPSPETTFNYQVAIRNRRRKRGASDFTYPQSHPQLQTWASKRQSSLFIIQGNSAARTLSRDLTVSVAESIKLNNMPVVWALSPQDTLSSEQKLKMPSSIDVLKHLVLQILRLNHTLLNERSAALNAARYKSATSESEWFELLGSAIAGLSQLYIVVDVEVIGLDCENTSIWPKRFNAMFEALMARNISSTVKVVLTSYRSHISVVEPSNFADGGILHLKGKRGQNASRVTKIRKHVREKAKKGVLIGRRTT